MVFTSGLVFFADIAGTGLRASAVFSFVYNITYIGPEIIVTLVIISLPAMRHAIDTVTKGIVSHDEYVLMTRQNHGSISARARLVTGTIISAFGGLAFVLVSYISRLEALVITQYTTGVELFADAPTRIIRMIERNTGHIAGLQTVGVVFLAVGVGLVVSTLLNQQGQMRE